MTIEFLKLVYNFNKKKRVLNVKSQYKNST
jgi:hypothetical protein